MRALVTAHLRAFGRIVVAKKRTRASTAAWVHQLTFAPPPPADQMSFTVGIHTRDTYNGVLRTSGQDVLDETLPAFWLCFVVPMNTTPQPTLVALPRPVHFPLTEAWPASSKPAVDIVRSHPCRLLDKRRSYLFACAQCSAPDVADAHLLACSHCRYTRYCSIECQRAHRPAHVLVCRAPACSCADDMNLAPPGATEACSPPPPPPSS
jgi:hypothetical protein